MMQFIDTHTHLYLPEFDGDRDEVVKRAVSSGISKMLLPNIDIHSVGQMLSSVSRYPGICYPMAGLHPTSVKQDYLFQLNTLETLYAHHRFIAVGEIGIDLYWDKTFIKEQIISLRRQIMYASENNLPIVIHSREAFSEVFSVLEEFRGETIQGVFHAFSGNMGEAIKAVDMGFKLGIGGIVTFKNSGLEEIIKEIGASNILLETDSPYLAPVPFRGKRNESSFIYLINKRLSEILEKSEEDIAEITYSNSMSLFKL